MHKVASSTWPVHSALSFTLSSRRSPPSIITRTVARGNGFRRDLLAVPVDTNTVLLTSAACFAAISLDVARTHLLLSGLDNLCHTWVVQHIPPEVRASTADVLVSDTFITLGLSGWAATSATILFRQPKGGFKSLLLAWGVYLSAAGAVTKGDPPLVWTLKELFHRTRPSTLHHTFSFPSGHTTAATFLIGGCLFVLLPAALADRSQSSAPESAAIDQTQPSPAGNAAVAIWILAALTTACGRILADAHWLSDTMAGAAIGTLLVALLRRVSGPQEEVNPKPRNEL
ncbi:hypothetical protein WJX74_003410 [Apatococcus lobatus]|uniref:Phosphatidic acid phosphatase type 2/haloperoxidase domain-containing protein n=1 Tax=Apatococcus lobatus TaxID=904363 RepID=A0AAW1QLR5_9CHLO